MKVEVNRARKSSDKSASPVTLMEDKDGDIWAIDMNRGKGLCINTGLELYDPVVTIQEIDDVFGPLKRFSGTVTLSNED